MEACSGFELIAIENATARGDDVLEISKRREVLVGEWLVEDGPEVFSRLKLGRVWGQVDGPDPVRNSQVRLSVPAGAVEPEHDDPLASRPSLARKQRQQCREKNGSVSKLVSRLWALWAPVTPWNSYPHFWTSPSKTELCNRAGPTP
jgi:hypothetical protein